MHVLLQYLQNRISHSRLLIRLVSHNYPSLYFTPVRLTSRPSFCVWFDSTRVPKRAARTHVINNATMILRTLELLTEHDEWNGSRRIIPLMPCFDNDDCESHANSKMNFDIEIWKLLSRIVSCLKWNIVKCKIKWNIWIIIKLRTTLSTCNLVIN